MKKLKSLKVFSAVTVVLLITASCSKLSGTYECGYGQKISFEGSKMTTKIGVVGASVETPYTFNGDEVKVEQNGVTATLYTLDQDGCLLGAGGLTKCCKDATGGNGSAKEEKQKPSAEETSAAEGAAKRTQDSIAKAIEESMK